jgi:hypothetical protein
MSSAADPRDPRAPQSMAARFRDSKMPALPPPGPDLTLRPHTTGSLVIEVVAAAISAYISIDAASGGYWGLATIGLLLTVAFAGGAALAQRRSTYAGRDGLTVRTAFGQRQIPWDEVDRFELLDRGRMLKPQIVVHTTGGETVKLPHQDAKALAVRPGISRLFYEGLIDRLETVRRTAGS